MTMETALTFHRTCGKQTNICHLIHGARRANVRQPSITLDGVVVGSRLTEVRDCPEAFLGHGQS
jgi:hypothetical protein